MMGGTGAGFCGSIGSYGLLSVATAQSLLGLIFLYIPTTHKKKKK